PVCALKESWKEAPQAIEELEKEGEVLVTRIVKDGQLRMVFWNEIKPGDETAGKHCGIHRVHFVLFDPWHWLKLPNDVDLLKALHTGTWYCTIPKAPSNVKKGECLAPRQRQATQIMNTHFKGENGLSRDYESK
ncbi:hypothetical protein C8R48DRAFT_614227, partial [Suillus tomentosus]